MIINSYAVVLSRRDVGEYDRLAALLTPAHGKVWVRFGGVNRSAGKLKALCEPMTWGEYRLHFNPRTQAVRALGGSILSTFPRLRENLGGTLEALSCCEMLAQLTPEREPAPARYELLRQALSLLDGGAQPWLETAFGLRLLELSGYSLRELPVPPAEKGLWDILHQCELPELAGLPWQAGAGRRFRETVYDHVEAHAERPLRSRLVASKL
jgi:DNA repair protein RecO